MNEEAVKKLTEHVVEVGATWALRVAGVMIALFVAWIVAGVLKRTFVRALQKRKFDDTLTKFFGNVIRYVVLTVAVIACLGVFGIQTASFAAILAAGGLAIGLAFQGTLSNFASGIMLLAFRPFKVGDVVVLGSVTGVVQEIELFTTELSALDNRRIIVPNSKIFGATIENLTHHATRRVDIPVGVAYSADIDETRKVLEAAAKRVANGLEDPPPQIMLKGLGASSVDWTVRVWCKTEDYWDVWEATIRGAKQALDGAKIGIPFPQLDLHLDRAGLDAIAHSQGAAPSPKDGPRAPS